LAEDADDEDEDAEDAEKEDLDVFKVQVQVKNRRVRAVPCCCSPLLARLVCLCVFAVGDRHDVVRRARRCGGGGGRCGVVGATDFGAQIDVEFLIAAQEARRCPGRLGDVGRYYWRFANARFVTKHYVKTDVSQTTDV
jgi:hypothetical protein